MISKLLIANRGEIACRIAKTARELGITTVAIYSDADAGSLHVMQCDEAYYVGPSTPSESYLLGDKIIDIALNCGATAIHPGYGFLSENAEFAETCKSKGLCFIGPKAEAIRAMGSKSAARQIMQAAGVPVLPGYDGEEQDNNYLLEQANKVGYPLLIKAVTGGGGKGMRVVKDSASFLEAVSSAKRESNAAFGESTVLLERYLDVARHIEVQIFADAHDNVVHLFERDCSMQRRHQKIIEEAPALGIDESLRGKMTEAAIRCAQAIDYVGAGTVEFLLAVDDSFYFMEMNTRLQVEHPVTEMICGQDLVAWQFLVANGEPLPLKQHQLQIDGHAIEARIYAEDTSQGFLPSIGKLHYLATPTNAPWLRIEIGVRQGDEITPHYDPMIAKVVVWGNNRQQAISRLKHTLDNVKLIGPRNNIELLTIVCGHSAFQQGETGTRFVEDHLDQLSHTQSESRLTGLICAAFCAINAEDTTALVQQRKSTEPNSPWAFTDSFRLGMNAPRSIALDFLDEVSHVKILSLEANQYQVEIDEQTYAVCGELISPGVATTLTIEGNEVKVIAIIDSARQIRVLLNNQQLSFQWVNPLAAPLEQIDQQGSLVAPMHGNVVACQVSAGDKVNKGDALVVVEAMKMEHTITAPHNGLIEEVYYGVGDQVEEGQTLLAFVQ